MEKIIDQGFNLAAFVCRATKCEIKVSAFD